MGTQRLGDVDSVAPGGLEMARPDVRPERQRKQRFVEPSVLEGTDGKWGQWTRGGFLVSKLRYSPRATCSHFSPGRGKRERVAFRADLLAVFT